MKFFYFLCIAYFLPGAFPARHQHAADAFTVVPLGVKGGADESNLSAYMLAVSGTNDYICLDAGTVFTGIQRAVHAGVFKAPVETVRASYIKGYLLSHPHLDHLAGLVLNSPDDTAKNIYALPFCIDVLKSTYFTWKGWANFASEGDTPRLGKYRYMALQPGVETPLEHTDLSVTPFRLSHSNPYLSTAFLIRHDDAYLLYLGDTGADSVEKSDNLYHLWKEIAPLVTAKKLKAIFIEVSFPNEQPVKQLFGHLTPSLLMEEMHALSRFTGDAALQGVPIVVTHRKPNGNQENRIATQLYRTNDLKLSLIFPGQARRMNF